MTLNSGTPLSPLLKTRLLDARLQSPSITNVKCAFHKGDLEIIQENLEKVKSRICCGSPRKRNVTYFSVIFLNNGLCPIKTLLKIPVGYDKYKLQRAKRYIQE